MTKVKEIKALWAAATHKTGNWYMEMESGDRNTVRCDNRRWVASVEDVDACLAIASAPEHIAILLQLVDELMRDNRTLRASLYEANGLTPLKNPDE